MMCAGLLVKLGRNGLSPASVHQAFRVSAYGPPRSSRAVSSSTLRPGRGLAPKITKVELRIPTPDEVATLAETIDPRDRAFVFVAAYCGLRRGELAGLRWGRVDLLRRRLSVVEQLNDQGEPVPLKSDAGRREVPIPSSVVDALTAHAEAGYGQPGPSGLVFTSPSGEYLDVSNFRARFLGSDVGRYRPRRHPYPRPTALLRVVDDRLGGRYQERADGDGSRFGNSDTRHVWPSDARSVGRHCGPSRMTSPGLLDLRKPHLF